MAAPQIAAWRGRGGGDALRPPSRSGGFLGLGGSPRASQHRCQQLCTACPCPYPPSPSWRMLWHPQRHAGTGHSRAIHRDFSVCGTSRAKGLGVPGARECPQPRAALGRAGDRLWEQGPAPAPCPGAASPVPWLVAMALRLPKRVSAAPDFAACKIWRVAGPTARLVPCPQAGWQWLSPLPGVWDGSFWGACGGCCPKGCFEGPPGWWQWGCPGHGQAFGMAAVPGGVRESVRALPSPTRLSRGGAHAHACQFIPGPNNLCLLCCKARDGAGSSGDTPKPRSAPAAEAPPTPSPELGRAQHLEGGRGRKAQFNPEPGPPRAVPP